MAAYNARAVEEKIRKFWEREKIYKFNSKKKGKIYSIDTPPPYASAGHLHVGHALSYTQFEIIARIKRQMGFNVYFPPGYDDNGLPTEKYVEEKLGIDKSRAEFRKLCLEESKKVEKIYTEEVFKKLGHSYDWDLLYTTISPEAQKISQTAFLKLVKKRDCYRSEEPVIWCPYHETALAQAEVEDLSRETTLNYIDFDLADGNKINIATTRPEFLPACVGIFVHPKDKKNKHLIGKEVIIPLFNYKVKVRTDETVDPEFGTGSMMVCTFGDTADIEKWKKYKLDLRNIINKDGTLNERADQYRGMKIEEARKAIIEDLKKAGRIKKQEPLQQTVGSCWRCSTPVEYIIAKQWFIKSLKYKKELIKRGREIKWYPDFMRKRFENWTENLSWDWIISRQRFYGVPIPVWYCEACEEVILPSEEELPLDPMEKKRKCPKCKKEAIPDTDVFDTWMTSSNSPEIASRWLKKPKLYRKIAPMSLRPQSHDIIRTWAFYTILKSHLLFDRIPWKNAVINTFVLDSKGRGMSKSKKNVVWADELMEKYSVDAFRYWVGGATLGSDLPFNEQELIAGKRFLTKLWNASNFVFMNLKGKPKKPKHLYGMDNEFFNQLIMLVNRATNYFNDYEYSKAKSEIETFFWSDFCDNYLEIVKWRVYNGKKEEKESAQYVLYQSLLTLLKMIAPITPFITEEIYQKNYKKYEKIKSIHLTEWPKESVEKLHQASYAGDQWPYFLKTLSRIRKEKSKANKPMNAKIILTIPKKEKNVLAGMWEDLKNVTNASDIGEGKFKVEFK
jgi:valyl-tRNA synthetase